MQPAVLTPRAHAELRAAVGKLDNIAARRGARRRCDGGSSYRGESSPRCLSPAMASAGYRFRSIPRYRTLPAYADATAPGSCGSFTHPRTSRGYPPIRCAETAKEPAADCDQIISPRFPEPAERSVENRRAARRAGEVSPFSSGARRFASNAATARPVRPARDRQERLLPHRSVRESGRQPLRFRPILCRATSKGRLLPHAPRPWRIRSH
jgi:hypothetical protein